MQAAQGAEVITRTVLGEIPYLKFSSGGYPREDLDAMIVLSGFINGYNETVNAYVIYQTTYTSNSILNSAPLSTSLSTVILPCSASTWVFTI